MHISFSGKIPRGIPSSANYPIPRNVDYRIIGQKTLYLFVNVFSCRPLQIPAILVRQPSEDTDHGGESSARASGDEDLEYVIFINNAGLFPS